MSETLLLAIETSTPRAGVAWTGGAGPDVAEETFTSDRSHNSGVFPPLRRVLAGRAQGAVEQVLVGTGPGSYSGVRIGIAAAQGVAMVHGRPVAGVPSLLGIEPARATGRCAVVGDARRGSWFVAVVEDGRLVEEPALFAAADFLQRLESELEAGARVASLDEVARLSLPGAVADRVERAWPRAGLLLEAWLAWPEEERQRWLAVPPQPVYLRDAFISVAKRGHPLTRG